MSRFKKPKLREPGLDWASDMVHAENPETTAENLRTLNERYVNHRSQARPILSKIAANPNCPPELLSELSDSYPEHVAANPFIKLALIEDPRWVALRLTYECVEMIQHTTEIPLLDIREEVRDHRRWNAPPDSEDAIEDDDDEPPF